MGIVKKVAAAASGTALVCSLAASVQAVEVDESMLLELKKLIEQQQQQLDTQAAQIADLKKQLDGPVAAAPAAKVAEQEQAAPTGVEKVVSSTFEQVDVNLYGHINRGVLWADNGKSSKTYFVENNNSQSRIGVNALVAPSEDFTIAGKIEYGIKANSSADVSQDESNGATDETWNLRHADIIFTSMNFGKVFLGHGSTASDGTSEVDLSGTSIVAYSSVGDLTGGQYFYDSDLDTLSEFRLKEVLSNMDGLGRDDRLRYDSPSLAGLTLSGSAVSGDAYDAAIKYSRSYGDTKVAAAIAWANPADANTSVDNQYNGSMSILLGNGLNATFAAGLRELNDEGRDDATTWYGKLGYRMNICSLGTTSVAVDFGENVDIRANGEKSKSWAISAVQDIPSWGTEFYVAYRNLSLDSDVESFEDIVGIMGGARIKF